MAGDISTVAVLGLANSTTAKTLFDEVGKDIRQSGMPFISDLSVSSLFADYANVFSTRGSQDNANLPVLRRFLKDSGAQRPAFIGIKNALFSAAMGDGLKGGDDIPPLVADHRLTLTNDKLDPEADYLLTIVARLLRWPDRPIRADEISQLAGCSVRTAYRLILRLKASGIIRAASRGH